MAKENISAELLMHYYGVCCGIIKKIQRVLKLFSDSHREQTDFGLITNVTFGYFLELSVVAHAPLRDLFIP